MARREPVRWRLAAFMVVSALLHLVAAGLYRPGPMPEAVPAPLLQWVELARQPAPPATQQPKRPTVPTPVPAPSLKPAARIEPPASAAPAPVLSDAETPFVAPPAPPAPLHHGDLLDQARRIARESAQAVYPAWRQAPAEADRPILPVLDRALAKPTPGTRRYANSLVRVVTASGHVYCLQEAPEFARGGPAELPAVATNCP